MRKIFKYTVFCLVTAALSACGDLYETHEQYLKMGEETYIGLADSLTTNGGFNRVELKWKLNADPRISACVITWNGNDKPIEIPADRSNEYMSTILNLPEGKYIFKIIVKSDSGKESLVQTVSGESYGNNYKARLPQRGINSFNATPEGVTINWAPEEGCIGVNLTYENKVGEKKKIFVKEDDNSTFIEDFVPGSDLTLTSLYKPEKNAIDIIESLESSMTFPSYFIISKADWDKTYHKQYIDVEHTAWSVEASTQEAGGEGPVNGYATALIDGKLDTFWHSAWSNGANPPLPHLITIDMLQPQDIISIEVARRQDNLDTKTVVLSISDDKTVWKELGVLNFPNDKNPNAMVLLLSKSVTGRYLRATVTESNNGVNASIAELFFTSKKKE